MCSGNVKTFDHLLTTDLLIVQDDLVQMNGRFDT